MSWKHPFSGRTANGSLHAGNPSVASFTAARSSDASPSRTASIFAIGPLHEAHATHASANAEKAAKLERMPANYHAAPPACEAYMDGDRRPGAALRVRRSPDRDVSRGRDRPGDGRLRGAP